MALVPYEGSGLGKKKQVENMFNHISGKYDLLNHLFSLNIDKIWRKRAIKLLACHQPQTILDVATGTGDFALAAVRLKPRKIVGIDLSEGMLDRGRDKVKKRGLEDLIDLQKADSEDLPFKENSFDAAIVAFGVRNFENPGKGLTEICRVLKPEGVFVVLEFSMPGKGIVHFFYTFYFFRVLPWLGRLVSKDLRAYSYLPESVARFPEGSDFIALLDKAGFHGAKYFPQTFGIATIYLAKKS